MSSRVSRIVTVCAIAALVGIAFFAGTLQSAQAGSHQRVVYLATGENYPDALGVGSLAALTNAPVLLVRKDAIPAVTLGELNRLEPYKVVIVGGAGVISQAVEDAIEALPFDPTVERLAGLDRYATAVAISESRFPAFLDAERVGGLDPWDLMLLDDYFPSKVYVDSGGGEIEVTSDSAVIRSVSFTTPWTGNVIANSTATVREITAGDGVECGIAFDSTGMQPGFVQYWRSPGDVANHAQLAGTRAWGYGQGADATVNLVCRHVGSGSDSSAVLDAALTVLWTPLP